MLLKPEQQEATNNCGFEHPLEVKQKIIPESMLWVNVLYKAISTVGKTSVDVINISNVCGQTSALHSSCVMPGEWAFIPDQERVSEDHKVNEGYLHRGYIRRPVNWLAIKALEERQGYSNHAWHYRPHLWPDDKEGKSHENLKIFVLDDCNKLLDLVRKYLL